ncbi:MAG: hypothetical protein GX643_12545, partial [Acidimicrobiales bacterium]|nr:hypothetical protein [Acidimicrobiales bacterium]
TSEGGARISDLVGDQQVLVVELDYSDITYSLRIADTAHADARVSELPVLLELNGEALDSAVVGGDGTQAVSVITPSSTSTMEGGLYLIALDGSQEPQFIGDRFDETALTGHHLLAWPDAP